MKHILGLDLGTNSIGWALIERNIEEKYGKIIGMGSRIIPMSQDILGKFDAGQSISQTAERTGFRSTRKLYQRDNLRRERLHRVLNILGFLPTHYANAIDFEKRLGQFKENQEPKLPYAKNEDGKFDFILKPSFEEMVADFKQYQPQLFYTKPNGKESQIPYDWTIYYLRKKALSQKLSKEELAWILLHFNQKRGYYQLRGEDEQADESKSVKFYALRVVKVEEDGKDKKGDTWYNVHLENGWVYRRTSKNFLDWEGKVREFIVTEELNEDGTIKLDKKDGREKRSFKAVNSEEDWIAIKKSTEDKINHSEKTVGAYIYDTLLQEPNQKIRGKLIRTIERKFYKDELIKILKKQIELQPELFTKDLYKACIEELYPYNEAHKKNISDRGFVYLFVEDIIFYQRPLKSKKSLIAKCTLEERSFVVEENGKRKEKTEGIKCIAKTNPIYQEFRLLQWFHNLKIYKKDDKTDIDITDELLPTIEAKEQFFEWLNDKASISQKELLKYPPFQLEEAVRKILVQKLEEKPKKKDIETGLEEYFRWNYVQDKVYPLNETRGEFLKVLKKNKLSPNFLNKETEYRLWHLLYSVEDKVAIESGLTKFAQKYNLPKEFVLAFSKFPRMEKNYGAFSEKAIKRLLTLMRFGKFWDFENIDDKTKERIDKIQTGEYDEKLKNRVREKAIHLTRDEHFQGLPLWLASYIIYNRHSEVSKIKYWKTADQIELLKQHSLRNPIVEQIINETLQTVREIWEYYGEGKENFFDEIHIELGREMKNPADKRKKMTERITENENTNIRIKLLLSELLNDGVEEVRPYSPMQQEILKIYEEGVYENEQDEKVLEEITKIRKKNQPTTKEINRYKLWLEQGYKSPYTGEMIPLSKLFTSAYQIEHIIPQSRYFDDSLSNKIICEAEVNELKDNQLAYEFIQNFGGQKVPIGRNETVTILKKEHYEDFVQKYFSKNSLKRKKLLMDEIPEDFIQRQLNDSRYISKVVNLLLSNIVREDDEEEARAKKVIVSSGGVTTRLKQDWGLNDIWNKLITPRFERLNQMAGYEKYGSWENKEGKKVFQINTTEQELMKLNKKRIDHRHHALDALIVACSTADHINYLNNESASENKKSERFDLRKKLRRTEKYIKDGKEREAAKEFYKPWETFTQDAKEALEQIIVSFKQNNRVINKSVNYYQKWEKQADGLMKKVFVKQKKGDNWAIRKPLHDPMPYGMKEYEINYLKIADNVSNYKFILDDFVRVQIEKIFLENGKKKGETQNYLKQNSIRSKEGDIVESTDFKIKLSKYRKRKPISVLSVRKGEDAIKTVNQMVDYINNKIADDVLRKDLLNHLKNVIDNNKDIENEENILDLAFSPEGIDSFNSKRNKPVYKLPIVEEGEKRFQLGNGKGSKHKYVQTAKGTNLFFAIYVNDKGERSYETIPLNVVIERQKQGLPSCPDINGEENRLLFSLSPNDLVYVPTEEEQEHPHLVDFNKLNKEQIKRVYKMVSTTQNKLECVPNHYAYPIIKNEMGTNNKNQRIQNFYDQNAVFEINNKGEKLPIMIKSVCWKLEIDRLGNIVKVIH